MLRRSSAVLSFLLLASLAPAPAGAFDLLVGDLPGMGVAAEQAPSSELSAEAPPVEPESQGMADEPEATPAPEGESAAAPEADEAPDAEALDAAGPADLGVVWRIFYARGAGLESNLGSLSDCPSAVTCDSYKVGRARWPVDATGRAVVPFRYNDSGRPSAAPGFDASLSAIRAGAAEWTRWNSNLAFSYAGTTSARFNAPGSDGTCDDGVNTVTWRSFPYDVVGATAICYDRRSYEIRDVDLAFNTVHAWANLSGPSSTNAFDLRAIATHEFGHWVSLFDLRFRKQSAQTMYASADPGETRKRTLALGDVLGAQAAYPCGSGDSCPRSGIVND